MTEQLVFNYIILIFMMVVLLVILVRNHKLEKKIAELETQHLLLYRETRPLPDTLHIFKQECSSNFGKLKIDMTDFMEMLRDQRSLVHELLMYLNLTAIRTQKNYEIKKREGTK